MEERFLSATLKGMGWIKLLFVLAPTLLATAALGEDDDASLEKRVESKVVADYQNEVSKPSPNARMKLEAKADQHSNSSKAATKTVVMLKVRPKKPPSKKPVPPRHK